MSLLEKIVQLYAPHTCVGCGHEQNLLLCHGCRESLPSVPPRCYSCQAVTRNYAVCADCRSTTPLRHLYAAVHYNDLARELLHRTKYERAQAGVAEMADILLPLLRLVPADALLVHVPTASGRVRQRGYDQAALLARQLGRRRGLPHYRLLVRVGQSHQVGSGRSDRQRHVRGTFRARQAGIIAGAHIVLVDDVLTTGATLEEAARTLKRAGARRVDAMVFAHAARP